MDTSIRDKKKAAFVLTMSLLLCSLFLSRIFPILFDFFFISAQWMKMNFIFGNQKKILRKIGNTNV